ncbi:MAG: cshE [Firmicutes bacterium]|nr:cshE [Bacillota bacterium]
MTTDFITLGIRSKLIETLKNIRIIVPTPIQTEAIPILMSGKDLIAQSQTGTGKTLAFLLPIIEQLKAQEPYAQALIITPTRELALQITAVAEQLADNIGLNVLSIYGGQAVDRQIRKLKGNPHIIIGTPGRLLDHLRRKTINLARVSKLVLDEADQMLHIGFLPDVEALIKSTAPKRQIMLFSATMPPLIRSLAAQYMTTPANINVRNQNVTLDEITQVVVELNKQDKLDKLCSLLDNYQPYLAIVFCHTKEQASAVNLALNHRGYNADELHGDLSPAQRKQVMRQFSDAKLQILVATDIAARGLDIEGITHIFNYDIPHDVESYIHRIGRTGRAGKKGLAVTFVVPGEEKYMLLIQQGIRASLKKQQASGQELYHIPNKTDSTRKQPLRQTQAKVSANTAIDGRTSTKKTSNHKGINQRSRRNKKSTETSPVKGKPSAKR